MDPDEESWLPVERRLVHVGGTDVKLLPRIGFDVLPHFLFVGGPAEAFALHVLFFRRGREVMTALVWHGGEDDQERFLHPLVGDEEGGNLDHDGFAISIADQRTDKLHMTINILTVSQKVRTGDERAVEAM